MFLHCRVRLTSPGLDKGESWCWCWDSCSNIVLCKKLVILNDFKLNHKISNQIQIKSHVFQIKSLFFKSNHYVWFNHDLNHIMIWICPSLPVADVFAVNVESAGDAHLPWCLLRTSCSELPADNAQPISPANTPQSGWVERTGPLKSRIQVCIVCLILIWSTWIANCIFCIIYVIY